MGEGIQKKKNRTNKTKGSRPTIGLLIGRLGDVGYAAKVWPGVADVAQERDINLICFVGGALRAAHEFDSQRNVVYDLAGPENLDGLLVMSGSIGQFIGPVELKRFYERYHSMPIVSIAMGLEGIPSVLVDNKSGMREAISHLIEVHKFRRIAFIRGPETNPEAEERYQTYREVLAEHGIPFDPDLIACGNFLSPAGAKAMRLLLDERKTHFDAVASANDEMVLGAVAELRGRGIQIPGQMSVIGFDDLEESKYSYPPLTTIRQPLYEQGRIATETLLDLLQGKQVPMELSLPTELVIRQSCGCFRHTTHLFLEEQQEREPGRLKADSISWKEQVILKMEFAAGGAAANLSSGWAERLLQAFSASLETHSTDPFLTDLDSTLRRVEAGNDDLLQWQRVLDVLRHRALPALSAAKDNNIIDSLWIQAGLLIGEIAQWSQANRRIQGERRAFEFTTSISEPLMTSFDVKGLTVVVANQLPQMGITSCYLALYEYSGPGKQETPSKWSRLILAYNPNGRIDLEPAGRRFLSRKLVPDGILPVEKRVALMLEPLHFRDEIQLGFMLFEPLQTKAGALREALSRQISIALKGALLLQERAQAEKALHNSEERYRSLLQFNNEILRNAPIGIIRLDTEMKIVYENPELETILGLPSDEPQSRGIGADIRQIAGVQKAGLVEALDELQKGNSILKESTFTSIYGKQTIVRINGCPIQEKGRSVGSVLLVEDITEHKRAEEALAASEERYRSLAEASHDMIYIIAPDGSIEYVNGFAARQFGLAPEAIKGKKMTKLFSGPDAARQRENILRVLDSNMPLYVEAPTTFPGGERWLGTWLVPLKDSPGRSAFVMGVSRDITERKKAEKELKEYSEKLEEMVGERTAELQEALQKAQMADRLKSEFLANVNHELRTPLTNLILYYQMLSAYPLVKTQERLDVIGRELQRLRNLIENLLNLSHLDLEQKSLRLKPHDLNELVQNLVNDRRAMAEERSLTLTLDLCPEASRIWMDEAMMIQAVSNLLTNAINYTPAGGQMRLHTLPSRDDDGRPGIVLCVQDTGPGISEADLPHIFERFYRGSAGHETGAPGTGLGLAIVKEVVDRHHGHISVENVKEGQGAVFTLWLPAERPFPSGSQ